MAMSQGLRSFGYIWRRGLNELSAERIRAALMKSPIPAIVMSMETACPLFNVSFKKRKEDNIPEIGTKSDNGATCDD